MMKATGSVILCLSFILGLLSTTIAMPWAQMLILVVTGITAIVLPRLWRSGPNQKLWLLAGAIALLASLYLQLRTPEPSKTDISHSIPESKIAAQQQTITVQGRVESVPRLTRSQKARFWLEVMQVNGINNPTQASDRGNRVTGKLYVTVPLLQATGLYPGQVINISGKLYRPEPAANPGGFDFKAYLEQMGCFAALRGQDIDFPQQSPPKWGMWQIQQRIVRSQIRWLDSPTAPLISSMVMGSRAVDLPYDIKDQFKQVGLAHALAASGFQTSLILAVVLSLTRNRSPRLQFALGTTALATFVALTGLEPAVLRAALMGVGALLALVIKRQVKPLGSLLLAATLLLLWNPLWIWNLGFQLSFLATMGLLVTVPPLTKKLDWLPTAIVPLIAVPIAAFLWTTPLLLHNFGVLSPYSIPANIISAPLISVISIGGIASALAAVIWSPAGSALAWLLAYPTQALLMVVEFFSHLSGNHYATGAIPTLTTIAIYGLFGLVWLRPWWRHHWWIAGLMTIVFISTPTWQTAATSRTTVLATEFPVMVVQDGKQVGLVNSGDEATAIHTVLPFLQRAGINQIDWAIATGSDVGIRNGWTKILEQIPVKAFYDSVPPKDASVSVQTVRSQLGGRNTYQPLSPNQSIQTGTVTVQLLSAEPIVLQLQMSQQRWLLIGEMTAQQQQELVQTKPLPQTDVLWWTGEFLDSGLLAMVHPRVAIATAAKIDETTASQLRQNQTKTYLTRHDGAIQWIASQGFESTLELSENESSPL